MTKGKGLLVTGVVAAALAALALGVAPGSLLLFGVALLCPAMMFFGMHGAGGRHEGGCCGGHAGRHESADARGAAGGEGRKAA